MKHSLLLFQLHEKNHPAVLIKVVRVYQIITLDIEHNSMQSHWEVGDKITTKESMTEIYNRRDENNSKKDEK